MLDWYNIVTDMLYRLGSYLKSLLLLFLIFLLNVLMFLFLKIIIIFSIRRLLLPQPTEPLSYRFKITMWLGLFRWGRMYAVIIVDIRFKDLTDLFHFLFLDFIINRFSRYLFYVKLFLSIFNDPFKRQLFRLLSLSLTVQSVTDHISSIVVILIHFCLPSINLRE